MTKTLYPRTNVSKLPMSDDLAYGWAVLRASCEKGPLTMAKREKIKLSGVYMLKHRVSFTAYAFDGQLKPDGNPHVSSLRTGEKDEAKARGKAEEWLEDLKVLWDFKYGASSTQAAAAAAMPADSIHQLLQDRLADLLAELGEGNTYLGYVSEVKVFLQILGPKRSRQRPDQLKPRHITRIRDIRLRRLNPERGAGAQSLRELRFILKEVPGFSAECLAALYAPRRKKGRRSKKFTDEFPFLDAELQIMIIKLPEASDTAQGLFLGGAAGSMHRADAYTMRWQQFDEASEAIAKGIRVKTDNPFYFGIWPEFIAWLKRRKRRKGDIYIFPEIMFGVRKMRKEPDCNQTPLKPEAESSNSIRSRAGQFFREFQVGICKIERPGVSFWSFRHYNFSELHATGHSVQLLMDLSGHDSIENLWKYIHSLPRHLRRAAISLRNHYIAIKEGREEPVCLTHTDVAEQITKVAHESNAELKRDVWQAVNHAALYVVKEFSRLLSSLPIVLADGRAMIELPRTFTPAGFLPFFGLNHAAQPDEFQQQLPLAFPEGSNPSLP
jgi:hypothetical protein